MILISVARGKMGKVAVDVDMTLFLTSSLLQLQGLERNIGRSINYTCVIMVDLLSLPQEVLHGILTEVNPTDLATVCRCCRSLNSLVRNNRLLHKELYLRSWVRPAVPKA